MTHEANRPLKLPLAFSTPEDGFRRTSSLVNQVVDGKTQNIGSVTLTDSSATTVVADLRVGVHSVIVFMPTTANAAAEVGAGGMYISSRGDSTFTITHANNAQTDRDFEYVVVG